jgi:hypothetical protein
MATQVQFRRGTAAQNNNFTGAEGELSVNLSNYSLRLHDGVTAGGYEIARQDFSNVTFGATVLPTLNTTYNLGSSGFKFLNVHSQEFTGDLTGNADTATALETARTINGVSFDGTADITIEASIDKTLFISEGLEDTGGLTSFDGGTDVTLRLKNAPNFSDTNLLKWDNTNEQFVDSIITDDGTTVTTTGNLTITGDLVVQGATTTISTTNLEVTDKLIIIGDGTTTTQAADGAGFNIGTSGVSLTYDLANTSWTSSESMNLATGKTYKIAGTTVIGSTSLGVNIVSSSLESVGNLTGLTVDGNATFNAPVIFNNATTHYGNVILRDDDHLTLGNESDLEIYHTPSTSYIDNNKGNLFIRNNVDGDDSGDIYIQAKSGENSIICYDDASVELYHNGISKFYTLSSGAYLNGYLISDGTLVRASTNANTYYEYAVNVENMTAGSTSVVDTWSYSGFNAAEYVITFDNYGATGGSTSSMQMTRFLVMSNGNGDLWTTEQGSLYTDEANPCFEASADISGSSARLLITPNSTYTNNNNDVKIKVTLFYR